VLSGLSALRTLELYGNPLAERESYKYRVCGTCPSVERLDGLNLKAGSFMRERMDQLTTEWETTRLVESTHQQAERWIEAERQVKQAASGLLSDRQNKLNMEFEGYKKQVDE